MRSFAISNSISNADILTVLCITGTSSSGTNGALSLSANPGVLYTAASLLLGVLSGCALLA